MDGARSLLAGFIVISLILTCPAQAENLPNPPATHASLLGEIGFVSVLLSTATLSSYQDAKHTVQYTLQDGTKIHGLLYVDPSKGSRPLVIADFGLMSSFTSTLAGDMIDKVVRPGLINANFLVVDDISSSDFYIANRSVSLGGYDAGRVLDELADTLRSQNVPFSRLSLMGESLGGLAVLEALIEDQRLGTHHFHSAITFSGVTDEARATATVMSAFGHDLSGISGPSLQTEGEVFLTDSVAGFDSAVSSSKTGLASPGVLGAGEFFYNQFADRLKSLEIADDWNSEVSRSSVEAYVESSSALLETIASVETPVILVHAQNDPVVPYSEFESFAEAQQENPRIQTFSTSHGSHCGFLGTYGASWVAGLINRSISL